MGHKEKKYFKKMGTQKIWGCVICKLHTYKNAEEAFGTRRNWVEVAVFAQGSGGVVGESPFTSGAYSVTEAVVVHGHHCAH